MKKWLIGCGIVVLLLGALGGWAFWRFVWQPGAELVGEGLQVVTETVQRAQDLGKTRTRLGELEQGIRNQSEYTPPADGLIDPDQLARWLTVESTVRDVIAADLKRLEDEAKQRIQAPKDTSAGQAERLRAGLAALGQLDDIAIRGKEAQVVALNAAEMSLAEYRWVRDTGLAALVAGGVSVNLDQFGQTSEQAERARRALAQFGQVLEGLGIAPETREVLERLSALLSGQPLGPEDLRPADSEPTSRDGSTSDARTDPTREAALRANFELVKDHAQAFASARLMALLGI